MAAAVIAVATPGCGFGPGEQSSGAASLVVTRDHGNERLLTATVTDPAEAETVARLLDREAEIQTSFGGNFIDSINGIEGSAGNDGRQDWFFYVNGYWSPVGAAEARVRAGDRIWWDYRRWDVAYRVPVVVGSWPAPFSAAEDPVELACTAPAPCGEIEAAIEGAGADVRAVAPNGGPDEPSARVVAGLWNQLQNDPGVRLLVRGPAASGVYMKTQGSQPIALDPSGEQGEAFAGLVASVRRGEQPPTWIVTGMTREALEDAAASLNEGDLTDRYALAISPEGERFGLPVQSP